MCGDRRSGWWSCATRTDPGRTAVIPMPAYEATRVASSSFATCQVRMSFSSRRGRSCDAGCVALVLHRPDWGHRWLTRLSATVRSPQSPSSTLRNDVEPIVVHEAYARRDTVSAQGDGFCRNHLYSPPLKHHVLAMSWLRATPVWG